MPKCVVIYGPTACGKTAMSIDIAKTLGTEIISTDSRQIFRGMDIGTGKIREEEKEGVVHHMIDIIEPNQNYSVGDFKVEAQKHIGTMLQKGKIPMLVGGTGLYIDSLIYESSIGSMPSDAELRRSFDTLSDAELYTRLEELDPEYARELHPNNRPYIERALEVKIVSGKSKKDFRGEKKLRYDVLFLTPYKGDREALYNRINMRVGIMFNEGLEAEVRGLLDAGYTRDDFGMRSIGYEEFFAYFDGEISLHEVQERISQHSRNYAKRQCTWFKKYVNNQ
ncbi:tRNA (adenosine(37)-N6)-dimethylallyltransferase MiaA [Candidatus Gracilibacteria bacterium]|nr:tRNA (adenosine(37)-N6)-dimethylallyltransferase MiaA [Candidatus Gracilibacteria bacterium]